MKNFEERCECGAYIASSEYKHIKKWRKTHQSYHPKEEPQPEGTTSQVERAPQWDWDDRPPIGFSPNP